MQLTRESLQKMINEAEAIVIGAGAGLSAAAGFEYGGKTFMDNFKYLYDEYGYTDMYSAGFHHFDSLEEKWGYWAKMIYLNRYKCEAKPLYKTLYQYVKDKNYFVITTNVDHQFQLSGFDKKRLFYMQGDYGLFQCSDACHRKTYDNKESIMKMLDHIYQHRIPADFIPKCPVCGKPMTTNLRCDDKFVEDEGWTQAQKSYKEFIAKNREKRILYLELGVGYSTPVWIKYPFMNLTLSNPKAKYICIDNGYISIPKELLPQSYIFNDDINKIIY